ncbi:MAG: TetR/AcrR family transcriptional regulator, partial [Anaerolineales bacterium]
VGSGYEAITIQDIVDRAQIGRTTFYLHYRSKDELFLHCHEAVIEQFQIGPDASGSREDLLAPTAPPGMIAAYHHLAEARAHLSPILRGKDGLLLLRLMRDRTAQAIETSLQQAFVEVDSSIPVGVLANYLAGAQVTLMQWWLEKRRPYSPDQLAQAFHRLQRAAIQDAFGLAGAA